MRDFFIAIAVFIGFGFWSIDIFKNSENFNGWIILTVFCSLTGFTMIFGDSTEEKKDDKEPFYKIGLYDKKNFNFGVIVTLFTGILTPILILKMDGFSFWQFLSGLFFIIGFGGIIKSVKKL